MITSDLAVWRLSLHYTLRGPLGRSCCQLRNTYSLRMIQAARTLCQSTPHEDSRHPWSAAAQLPLSRATPHTQIARAGAGLPHSRWISGTCAAGGVDFAAPACRRFAHSKLDVYSTHAAKRDHLSDPRVVRRRLPSPRTWPFDLRRGRFSCRTENDDPRCRFLPLRRLTTPSRRGIAQPKPAEVRIFLSLCSVEQAPVRLDGRDGPVRAMRIAAFPYLECQEFAVKSQTRRPTGAGKQRPTSKDRPCKCQDDSCWDPTKTHARSDPTT